jgi:hypothetical protein
VELSLDDTQAELVVRLLRVCGPLLEADEQAVVADVVATIVVERMTRGMRWVRVDS